MDLKMEVYSPALELLGVLEVQRSVIWESKAFSCGSFSVESLITDESRALLVPENIIWIEGETAGIIEHVQRQAQREGPYITAKGRDLTGILDRRILWGQYDLYGTVPDLMRQLVDDCCIHPTRGDKEARVVPGLVLEESSPAAGEKVRKQQTGCTLLEALEELGEAYQVAFGVRFNPEVPRMEFWARYGADRSTGQTANEPVFYSTELDDVLTSDYTYDSNNYRNVTLVAGEGEGADRVSVTVENPVESEPEPQPPVTTEYTITLSVDPDGGGVVTGGGKAQSGASVTVTADPSEGYAFVGWQENGAIVSTEASYTFQANGDRSLTAVFAVDVARYTITTSVDPAGAGTASGGGSFEEGQSVTLTASPADGYEFSAWRENGTNVSTSASYTFTASANRTITAVFAAIPSYTVTASIDPSGAGAVTGAGTYRRGTSVTVTATPADGYTFSGWKNGSTTVSTAASYTFTVTGNVTLTAAFAKASRLPAGYTELQYVEFPSSSCYIKTPLIMGYIGSGTIEAKFEIVTHNTSTTAKYLFYSYASNAYFYLSEVKSGVKGKCGTSSTAETTFISNNTTSVINVSVASSKFTVNGVTASMGTKPSSNTGQIYFNGNGSNGIAKLRLYSWKSASASSTTSSTSGSDYVPCKNASGTVGLFNLRNNTFLSATSSTQLTAGPAV